MRRLILLVTLFVPAAAAAQSPPALTVALEAELAHSRRIPGST